MATEQELADWWNDAFRNATAHIRWRADEIMRATKGTYEERLKIANDWEQKALQPFREQFMAEASARASAKGIVFTKLQGVKE